MAKIINNMRTLFFIAGLPSCAVIISYEYEMPLHILVVLTSTIFSIFTLFSQIFHNIFKLCRRAKHPHSFPDYPPYRAVIKDGLFQFPWHTRKRHEIILYYALFAFETQGKPAPVMMYYPLQKKERRTARHSPIRPFQENCPETSMSPTIVRQPHRFHGFNFFVSVQTLSHTIRTMQTHTSCRIPA